MANKSTVPFQGTKEQETVLREVIEKRKSEQGALMAVLQQAQEIYGYVPTEVQTIISDEMDIPLHKIEEVVDFYPQFTLSPKGKYQVSICLGTACFVKGAGDVYNKLTEVLGMKGNKKIMEMSLRWYGSKFDTVTLQQIRQIPGVTGVITTLYDTTPGEVWSRERIREMKAEVEAAGLHVAGIESVNVHDAIKTGAADRDKYIDNY